MDLFDEITKTKEDFPKGKTIRDEISTHSFNFYQIFAISLFISFFFLGIFFGNLFATCQATSYFYADQCLVTEFNFSVMVLVWFIGIVLCAFHYAIGHIIQLLGDILEKLSKFKS